MSDAFPPSLEAAHQRIDALQPQAYARTRNALDGAVSRLSPYLTHGFVTLDEVLRAVRSRHALQAQHSFVRELGWRAYFRHVWSHGGDDALLHSGHPGPLPDEAYARDLPADIRQGRTGVPVIDRAVRTLYDTGWLHNHLRLWLASYVVHVRKVHWRVGADWLVAHLLDGDLASNHLSWQWVAGTLSRKPYLFNAANVARHAPAPWHSGGSVIDTSYETLDAWAHSPGLPAAVQVAIHAPTVGAKGGEANGDGTQPPLFSAPPADLRLQRPDAAAVAGREVWLVHPWSLGACPPPFAAPLPPQAIVIGLVLEDFHRAWPWSARRWAFVGQRLSALAPQTWQGRAEEVAAALRGARRVRSVADPHLAAWLPSLAELVDPPSPFPVIEERCASFSRWWTLVTRRLERGAA